MKNIRRYLQCCFICPLLFLSCQSVLTKAPSVRIVHIKAVADASFTHNTFWKKNIGNLIAIASDFYESWFNCRFVIDTIESFDIGSASCKNLMFDMDCIMESVPKGNSDIVLFFSKEFNPYQFDLAGLAQIQFGYCIITQASWVTMNTGYENAYITLIHELAHIFGAVHVLPHVDSKCVMKYGNWNETVQKVGTSTKLVNIDFHPGNVYIMNGCIGRPFSIDSWDESDWGSISRGYRRMRKEYCNFYINNNKLSGMEFNEFFQEDQYYYLGRWALLCGKDTLALKYADSLVMFSTSARKFCDECGAHRQANVCTRIGIVQGEMPSWVKYIEAQRHLLRMEIFLHEKKVLLAKDELNSFFALYPSLSSMVKEKYNNHFQLYSLLYKAYPDIPWEPKKEDE